MPDGYGVPETDEGVLPWRWAEERLTAARNYWFSTTRPDGRPHAVPAWAVWVDGALYFDGSPRTRRGRNIAQNPSIVVHLESGDEVVIVEGNAEDASGPTPELAAQLVEALATKYERDGYRPTPDQWDREGLWRVRPRVAYAWGSFPKDVTRFRFGPRS